MSHSFYGMEREEAERKATEANRLAALCDPSEVLHWRRDRVRAKADDQARRFRELCLARFPEWEERMELWPQWIDDGEGGQHPNDRYSLRIVIPSQHPHEPEPLLVLASADEVFFTWMRPWHEDVYAWQAESVNAEFEQYAFRQLCDFLDERVLAVNHFLGGQVVGGSTLPVEMPIPDDWRIIREGPFATDRTVIRSWRGTHDQDILPSPP